MEKVTAFKATDGSLHNTEEKALEVSITSFLYEKARKAVLDRYGSSALRTACSDIIEYLSKNPKEFIDFYHEQSGVKSQIFTKEDLENAYNRGYHDDEYVRNGNSGGFKDWYEDEYEKD